MLSDTESNVSGREKESIATAGCGLGHTCMRSGPGAIKATVHIAPYKLTPLYIQVAKTHNIILFKLR